METMVVGVLGIILLLVLLAAGMSIGIAMATVGFLGFSYLTSFNAGLGILKVVPYSKCANYTLSVVPLFILMGHFAYHSGLSKQLYNACHRWIGFLPGGLAMATIGACAGFAAICGSSPATAATMGTVCMPEMKKYNYESSLSTGSVAAGGTLGILIPPSVGFVIYGVITENSIMSLFMAGIIPGIILMVMFMIAIYITVAKDPEKGPVGPKYSLSEKMLALKSVWGVASLFAFVIGGMFFGWFTPTEAAAIGAFGTLLFMIGRGNFTWKVFTECLIDTGKTTGMIFIILIGAFIFGYFLAITRIPANLTEFVSALPLPPTAILFLILLVFMLLGCIMDALAMISLTVPIFYPVVMSLGFDPIWFGVMCVVVMEMALITPPVGMNVYVLAGVARDVPLETIFKGILPFWIAMILFAVILFLFPQIATFLPSMMK